MVRTADLPARRRLLAAGAAAGLLPWPRLSLAEGDLTRRERFVFLILRGGMDGLMAVPAPGDPSFEPARGALAHAADAWLPLDGPFALHPLLPGLHERFRDRELLVLHATGLPYRERSHFDAQQVLESGGSRPHELVSGWLGRSLQAVGGRGLALATAVPLALRGADAVDSWSPSRGAEPGADLVTRLAALYADDPALRTALARAHALREDASMPAGTRGGMAPATTSRELARTLAQQAAGFLAADGGPTTAVLELGGWDSHVNQAASQGAAANNLRTLDTVLGTLRDGLRPRGTWARTVVLVATEFGREVAANGTGGTDHGSGGVAMLLGGAVRGGRVLADWPGLSPRDRFEGRDLRITTDLRALLRPLLADHLRVPRAALDREVLPGSSALPMLDVLRG